MTHDAILQAALAAHDAGLCVIPVAADRQKRPAVRWRHYTQAGGGEPRPTLDQLRAWFTGGTYDGLGIVTGTASGNLELFEFEGRALAENIVGDLAALAQASGLGELWTRVRAGYAESTPSGGIHILYQVDGDAARNSKLASRPAAEGELDEREREVRAAKPGAAFPRVLIETRAEGGFVVVAPSGGRSHPSGLSWTLLAGGFTTIATITVQERDALHALAAALDQMPTEVPAALPVPATLPSSPLFTQPAPFPAYDDDGISPGDDYNERTTWDQILAPEGWTKVYTDGQGVTYWRRPGKRDGISATTGRGDGDNLYVFTTSTVFDTERPYDRFGAHTLLTQGSTTPAALSAAARSLQAAGYGHRPPATIPAPAVQPPPLTAAGTPQEETVQVTLAHSDDGAALGLIDRYGEVIRYCPSRGRWLAWTGVRWEWQPAGGGLVREYAKQAARDLPEDGKAAVTHKKTALSAAGTTATLTQAATDVRVTVALADLDAHPWELNTPSGIVCLRTGELRPCDASRLHTKVTACTPDPQADMSRWSDFLKETFDGDDALIEYLRRLMGYSATGSTEKHLMPFCAGSGGNGKGVFLEALMGVLGDYATTAPSGFLMAKTSIQHETEIARLAGMRMVVCSEVDEDARFDETKVKSLTGGDSLTARFMRQDHFTFTPTHHLWLMGNHQPSVRSGGRAFWRRLRLIPFLHEVPAEEAVDDLQGIFVREHGGALMAWIVAGAAAYARQGLDEPESVMAATDGYAADQDTVTRFVEDCCRLAPATPDHVQVKKTTLREAYEAWCAAEGETPVSPKKLTQELGRRFGVGERRAKTARFYAGIAVLGEESESRGFSAPDGRDGGPGW